MPDQLIIVSSARDGPLVVDFCRRQAPRLPVRLAVTVAQLEAMRPGLTHRSRILAFCSGTIVPRAILDAVGGAAYNIHPGPPTFPGTFPDVWALYADARRFGATIHVMAPRVDEGPIVDVDMFDVERGADRPWLALEAMKAAARLLTRWAPVIAQSMEPLPTRRDLQWSGHKSTMAEFHDLCRIDTGMTREEVDRRARSVVGGALGTLNCDLHGIRFALPPMTEPEPVFT